MKKYWAKKKAESITTVTLDEYLNKRLFLNADKSEEHKTKLLKKRRRDWLSANTTKANKDAVEAIKQYDIAHKMPTSDRIKLDLNKGIVREEFE
jgi:hypothetical protein